MKFIKIIMASVALTVAASSFAQMNTHKYMNRVVPARHCKNLTCVRDNIDSINAKIVRLLGERLQYVKRAGELKKNVKSVHDQKRENEILHSVSMQAKKLGYPGSVAVAVFKTILAQSNVYEKQFHHYK
jgi:isochorismate pyruvate lyase